MDFSNIEARVDIVKEYHRGEKPELRSQSNREVELNFLHPVLWFCGLIVGTVVITMALIYGVWFAMALIG